MSGDLTRVLHPRPQGQGAGARQGGLRLHRAGRERHGRQDHPGLISGGVMGNLRHPIAMFIMAILVVIGIGVGVLAATMPPSGPTYSLKVLVADVNVLYKSYGSSPPYVDFRLVPSRPVPLSEAAAARKAITVCNEGRGTQVIAAGLVTGVVNAGSPSSVAWAIFIDRKSTRLNSSHLGI